MIEIAVGEYDMDMAKIMAAATKKMHEERDKYHINNITNANCIRAGWFIFSDLIFFIPLTFSLSFLQTTKEALLMISWLYTNSTQKTTMSTVHKNLNIKWPVRSRTTIANFGWPNVMKVLQFSCSSSYSSIGTSRQAVVMR